MVDIQVITYRGDSIPKNSVIGVLVPEKNKWAWDRKIPDEYTEIAEIVSEKYPLKNSIGWAIAIKEGEQITIIIQPKDES